MTTILTTPYHLPVEEVTKALNTHTLQQHAKGFTLIELITTLLIVSLLSAIAVPKFANLSYSASITALRAVKGSLNSAVTMIRAEAIAQDLYSITNATDMTVDGNTIRIYNQGVPREIWTNGLENFIDIDVNHLGSGRTPDQTTVCTGNHFCLYDNIIMSNIISGKAGFGLAIFPKGYSLGDDCYAYYAFDTQGGQLQYMESKTIETGC